jgi:lysozyme
MDASASAVKLISEFEGFSSKPYKDIRGIATIGYGFTHYLDGRSVTMSDLPISRQDADVLISQLASGIAGRISKLVTVPITQNQLDALMSFAYNLGVGSLSGSTLLKLLNTGNYHGAAAEFVKWCRAGGGNVVPGLLRRREAEQALFLKA